MTTAAERRARREERLLKEAKKERVLSVIWTGMKYIGAIAGTATGAIWLALAMQENPQWWMETSWAIGSICIGAFLFHKVAK